MSTAELEYDEVDEILSDDEYFKLRWDDLNPKDRAKIASAVEQTHARPEYRKIKLSDLHFDDKYQRSVSHDRVMDIVKNFDWNLYDALWVGDRKRSGKLYVVDGRHRFHAAVLLPGMKDVWCAVRPTTSSEQEARIFVHLTTKRRKMTPAQQFQAKLHYGDEDAIAIQGIVTKHRFQISDGSLFRESGYLENTILAVGSIERIYTEGGRKALDNVLYTLRKAWDGAPGTLASWPLRAMHRLYERYPDADRDRVAKYLGEVDPWSLIERGQRFGRSNNIAQAEATADVFCKVAKL